jgi:hypothetical protein
MRSATAGLTRRRTARCRAHQRQERRQEPAVDRPPPGRPGFCRDGSALSCPSDGDFTTSIAFAACLKCFAADFEILELVETGAGRRQQHHSLGRSVFGRIRAACSTAWPACLKSRRAPPRRASPQTPAPPRRSDRPWRCAGRSRASGRCRLPWAGRRRSSRCAEARQRLRCSIGIGRLGIVDEQRHGRCGRPAPCGAQAGKAFQPGADFVRSEPDRQAGGNRRQRVLRIVLPRSEPMPSRSATRL